MTWSFPTSNIIFVDFCDDNVCTSSVGTLMLIQVANLSPEMDSATPISYQMQTFRL